MTRVVEMPPRGHYLAHEAGRLAGVSGDQIGQWARRGYIRSSQHADGPPLVYSFQDIAEAMVVHELLERGAAHRAIKAAIGDLRKRYGSSWPLSQSPARLLIAEEHVEASKPLRHVYVAEGDEVRDVKGGRLLGEFALDEVALNLRSGGWAARGLDLRHIEVDPDRLSGRPVVRGTRIPADDAGKLATSAAGRRVLRDDYDLGKDQIDDVRRWWSAVQGYESALAS